MPADIQITGLCKSYRDKKVLDNLSLTIKAGSITALMAPSGAGKTTLLRILMGLETPDSGTILGLTNQRISAVFQEDRLCDNLSPVSNIRLTAGTHFPRRAITDALEATGILSCAAQPVRELSGGQRRRVALLRALLAPYDLLLLDEPFKGLDAQTRLQVITYTQTALQTAAADSPTPQTVLLVTHSPEEATLLATQTLSLV